MAAVSVPTRSVGLKFLLVGAIAVLLAIPLGIVSMLAWERSSRADEVVRDVGAQFGGRQTVSGPFLVVPYRHTEFVERTVTLPAEEGEVGQRTRIEREPVVRRGRVTITADTASYEVEQTVYSRRRGIYSAPVYDAVVSLSGRFDSAAETAADLAPDNAVFDWGEARLGLSLTDLTAIDEAPVFTMTGRPSPLQFEPGQRYDMEADVGAGFDGGAFGFSGALKFSGGAALFLRASGQDTQVKVVSNWPHPSFQGQYLPDDFIARDDGYEASWSIPFLSRGAPKGRLNDGRWTIPSFGVELATPGNGYVSVGRSLKYAMFFLGLVMLMFFLLEVTSKGRLHGAQYILIGLAQVVFYLLLLGLSEHASVSLAYGLASVATVVLTGLYAGQALGSAVRGMATLAVLAGVYAAQYLLVLVEDFALLIGSVMAFLSLALAMVMTRNVEWYGARAAESTEESTGTSTGPAV